MSELEDYKKTLEWITSDQPYITTRASDKAAEVLAKYKPKPHPLEGLPVDTLLEVWDDKRESPKLRYFSHYDAANRAIHCFTSGTTRVTADGETKGWQHCRLAEGRWEGWQGGECPLPGWVKVKVIIRDGGDYKYASGASLADEWVWSHEGDSADIIAYQIQAQEIPE